MVYILSVFYLFKSRSESILIVYQTWDITFLLPKFHTVCNRPKKGDENNNDDNDNNINNNKINYNNNNNIINGNDNNSNHNSNNNSSNSNDKANKKVCI